MRVAVVGLGRIGVMHARNLAQNLEVDEVVLVGRSESRLAAAQATIDDASAADAPVELAGEHREGSHAAAILVSTSIEQSLAGADAVVIASSTASHPELVRQSVAAGKPVLVEKPIALEPEQLVALAAELQGSAVPVMVGFHRRYDAAYTALRDRIARGDLGTVMLARAISHDRQAPAPGYIPTSGGIWRDLMIHDFDILPWVLNDRVVSVHAVGSVLTDTELTGPVYAGSGDADAATAVLTLESGATAVVTGTRANGAGQDVRLEVFGSRNTLAVGLEERTPVTSVEPGVLAPARYYDDFIDRFERAFRAEAAHFLKVVRGESENLTPPEAGLASLQIALACAESRQTGITVRLKEMKEWQS